MERNKKEGKRIGAHKRSDLAEDGRRFFFSQPFPVTFTITQKEGLLPISFVKAFHRDLARSYISFFL